MQLPTDQDPARNLQPAQSHRPTKCCRQIQGQIAEAVKLILEPDSLKAAVVKLYQMHVEGTDHNRKSNVDIEQEFGRCATSSVSS